MRTLTVGFAAAILVMGCGDDDVAGSNNQNENNTEAMCGNGILETGEVCDDGSANSDSTPDACRTDCRASWCGDSVVDSDEMCDDGNSNSDHLPNACRKNCQEASCGDGTVDQQEVCDDGNSDPGDGCDESCQVELFWDCSDRPSQCVCMPYHSGANCRECVVYVDGDSSAFPPDGLTWSTAYPRVQQGIDAAHAAGPGCEVWVTQGTYLIYEYSPTNTVRLLNNVGVYGGFLGSETQRDERDWEVNETLLDGQISQYVFVYHVVEANDTLDATLDGFTITGGSAFGTDSEDHRGAGISTKGSQITVANCTIRNNQGLNGAGLANEGSVTVLHNIWFLDNTASNRGGAIFNNGGSTQLTDCSFVGNHADVLGGAIYNGYTSLNLNRCEFTENSAYDSGGAVYTKASAQTITDCNFIDNYIPPPLLNSSHLHQGGALSAFRGTQILTNCLFQGNDGYRGGGLALSETTSTVSRCIFIDNTARAYQIGPNTLGGQGGAIYTLDASAVIESCLMADNGADRHGGGLYSDASISTLVGCTVANNDATDFGGGFSIVYQSTSEITNCVLWGNTAGTAPAINTYMESQSLLLHNDIQGGIPTDTTDLGGNISVDPDFVDGPNDDYHLGASSECIDAGWGDSSMPALDLDGNPRVDLGESGANGGMGTPNYVDMGAYERQ